ncbi:uncharacterized protein METZ01_LOCUS357309, partial [marine metagenome]
VEVPLFALKFKTTAVIKKWRIEFFESFFVTGWMGRFGNG